MKKIEILKLNRSEGTVLFLYENKEYKRVYTTGYTTMSKNFGYIIFNFKGKKRKIKYN